MCPLSSGIPPTSLSTPSLQLTYFSSGTLSSFNFSVFSFHNSRLADIESPEFISFFFPSFLLSNFLSILLLVDSLNFTFQPSERFFLYHICNLRDVFLVFCMLSLSLKGILIFSENYYHFENDIFFFLPQCYINSIFSSPCIAFVSSKCSLSPSVYFSLPFTLEDSPKCSMLFFLFVFCGNV